MAHEPNFKAPTHEEIQQIIARARDMRAEQNAEIMRGLLSAITRVFTRRPAAADASA